MKRLPEPWHEAITTIGIAFPITVIITVVAVILWKLLPINFNSVEYFIACILPIIAGTVLMLCSIYAIASRFLP